MIRIRPILVFPIAITLIMASCSSLNPNMRLDKLVDTARSEIISKDPLLFGPEAIYSNSQFEDWFNQVEELKNECSKLNAEKLNPKARLKHEVLKEYLQLCAERRKFENLIIPISHVHGPQLRLTNRLKRLPISNESEIETYLDEIYRSEVIVGDIIDVLEAQRKAGVLLPSFILRKLEDQCDRSYEKSTKEHFIYTTFRDSLEVQRFIPNEKKQALLQDCEDRIRSVWKPNFKRLSAYLLQLEQSAVAVSGLWHQPNGDDFFKYLMKFYANYTGDLDTLYLIVKQDLQSINGQLSALESLGNLSDSAESYLNASFDWKVETATGNGEALFTEFERLSEQKSASIEDQRAFLLQNKIATVALIADIGLHRKQWLRDQAIKFVSNETGLGVDESEEVVDRIIVHPGYVSTQKIGFWNLKRMIDQKDSEQLEIGKKRMKLKRLIIDESVLN